MDSTTQLLTLLIVVLTMVISIIVTQFIRRRPNLYTLRDIPAFSRLPGMIGAAIESNRPVHVSLGSAGLGGESTLLALANAEFFYQITRRAVIGTTAPIITIADPTALPLAEDTLRRAYASRDMIDRFRQGNVRWYPGGARSLAFAAALTVTLPADQVGANVLAGSFGSELALVGEAALRRDQSLLATSDQLEGQAIAYVMSEEPLIGEEVFTAGAYLGGSASQVAGVVTQDVLRWLVILGVLLAVADSLSGRVFSQFFGRLIGGG